MTRNSKQCGGRVMKKFFYFAAFAACVLTSCQQVEKEEDIKTPGLVFTATTESSATKTALEEDSGNYNVAWPFTASGTLRRTRPATSFSIIHFENSTVS